MFILNAKFSGAKVTQPAKITPLSPIGPAPRSSLKACEPRISDSERAKSKTPPVYLQ